MSYHLYVQKHVKRHVAVKVETWQGSCQLLFLAAKFTFGSWHAGTHGLHTQSRIFDSEKHLWQNPANDLSGPEAEYCRLILLHFQM